MSELGPNRVPRSRTSGNPATGAHRKRNSRTLNLAQVIGVPTLVVWGERDVALDPICLKGTERYVRDLRVKRLPGVSHWVQQDAPKVVNELLREFLA